MEYLKRTWKNKAAAIAMLVIGLMALYLDNDITVLIICSVIAIPLIVAKDSFFYEKEDEDDDLL